MTQIYFTFGSDPAFPYQRGDYVIIIGANKKDCLNTFKETYPNRPGSTALNCADYYSRKEWDMTVSEYYKDVKPKKLIVSDMAYAAKTNGFDPIWFFVPAKNDIIYLQENSGYTMTPEDTEKGNVDYLDYTVYSMADGQIYMNGGCELLLPYKVREHYKRLVDAIPYILEFHYDDMFLNVVILNESIK